MHVVSAWPGTRPMEERGEPVVHVHMVPIAQRQQWIPVGSHRACATDRRGAARRGLGSRHSWSATRSNPARVRAHDRQRVPRLGAHVKRRRSVRTNGSPALPHPAPPSRTTALWGVFFRGAPADLRLLSLRDAMRWHIGGRRRSTRARGGHAGVCRLQHRQSPASPDGQRAPNQSKAHIRGAGQGTLSPWGPGLPRGLRVQARSGGRPSTWHGEVFVGAPGVQASTRTQASSRAALIVVSMAS
jgi:hypothetical protein